MKNIEPKGWIALDIDGTITLDKYSVPQEVIDYLRFLQRDGWNIVLATGRPFSFAIRALSKFDFHFVLLAQNGSLALELPERKIVFKSYIPSKSLHFFDQAYIGHNTDYLVYAGYDQGDFCYWRPKRFSKSDLKYISELKTRHSRSWEEVEKFEDIPAEGFPLVECFGSPSVMADIGGKLQSFNAFEVAKIKDPFDKNYHLLLVTDLGASKGKSFLKLLEIRGRGNCVIAAGDDENDLSLLKTADIKIAMEHAPKSLHEIATIIAPPTKDNGIINAIKIALKKIG